MLRTEPVEELTSEGTANGEGYESPRTKNKQMTKNPKTQQANMNIQELADRQQPPNTVSKQKISNPNSGRKEALRNTYQSIPSDSQSCTNDQEVFNGHATGSITGGNTGGGSKIKHYDEMA